MHAERPLDMPELDLLIEISRSEGFDDAATHARQWRAVRVVAASALIGILGNGMFYYFPLGINIPLFVLILASIALALTVDFARPVVRHNAALFFPAILFATFLSLINAPQLILFNGALALGALIMALRFISVPQFLGGHWLAPVQTAIETAMIGWIEGPITLLGDTTAYLKRIEIERYRIAHLSSIVRGLALTIPVVGLFALLLSSADVVFGRLLLNVVNWLTPNSAHAIMVQCMIVGAFAWLALTGFRLMLHDHPATPSPLRSRIGAAAKPSPFRVGMIEAGMLLGSVDMLFALFIVIQARYLFGGHANITIEGYTYADYARRGFYELLMVSFMTMLLALAVNSMTHRKREREALFRALTGIMIGLTLLLLAAAYYRLHLYQDAYGFTRIRVMSGVFMFWLGVLLITLLVTILRHTPNWFGMGVLLTAAGFVLTLNVINMDGFIARQNITRFDDSGKLDVAYLLTLSDDAIPVVANLLDRRDLPDDMRETLLVGLGHRFYLLDTDRADWHLLGYHWGKDRAWHALNDHRVTLQAYRVPGWRSGVDMRW